jgi:uncharacterized protein (DUF58 family)
VVDYSASGGFGSRLRTKEQLAAVLCGVRAVAAARNNDRVGALCFTDRVERYIPPRKGRRHVLRVISDLIGYQPSGRGTDLSSALGYLEPVLRRRAVIFVVSVFLALGYEAPLGRLARRHDVIALQLRDRRERELPDIGLATLWDPESDRWRVVDTADQRLRNHFRRKAEEFDATLERELRRSGTDHLVLDTDRSYAEPLLAFFRRRERMLWR